MTAAPTIAIGPEALLEFALGSATDAEHVRASRTALTAWIRGSVASELSLLAQAERVAEEVGRILDGGGTATSDMLRLRQFALATRAALAQNAADEEINRHLALIVKWSEEAGLADAALVAAQADRAEHLLRAAGRWAALADLLDDVSDVLAIVEARSEQGADAAKPWPEVKRDLGLSE